MAVPPSRRLLVGVAASLTLALFGFVPTLSAQSPGGADTPTWYGDVLPIVQESCVDCHQPQGKNMGGMVAPFSMTSYEEARPWARMMAFMVETGQMPPWDAHPVHEGTFVNDLYLTEEEKRTIVAWGEAGGPEGDPADAPTEVTAAVESSEGGDWWIGEPDLVVTFAEPFEVHDDIVDLNMANQFVVPERHDEARWIKASELRGGQAVHHICGEPFGCIAPGWDPYQYPDGYAQLLPPADMVPELGLSMHYNKKPGAGTGFADESKGALVFYEDGEVIDHFVRRSVLHADFPPIPAGHPYFSYTHEFEFEEDSYILSFTPHMHLRGRAAKYELEYPDGTRELLLWVPEYDFEWQRTYVFEDPPVAPAGSKVLWTATWDNSEFNPANPDPTVDVTYGGPTFMEMANGWMDYTNVEPLGHVVGEDPIPQDILDEVVQQLNRRAESDSFSPVWAPGTEHLHPEATEVEEGEFEGRSEAP